jgi:16S rRNA (cytosine1402-N4)-methyltransferase
MTFSHLPVLLEPALDFLAPRSGGFYVDGTLGGASHALACLEASAPDGRLLGIDRDPEAVEAARERLVSLDERVRIVHGKASELARHLAETGWGAPTGVFFDFGVSSHQLDCAQRGFSFQADGPLDMRMDPTTGASAADLVNGLAESDLADLLWRFGEEPRSRAIARAIVQSRPLSSTLELARVIERAVGGRRGARIHPATRGFQALRIAVNGELEEVRTAVSAALDAVAPGGRVVTLTFHSLEDRVVKTLFAQAAGLGAPQDIFGRPIDEPLFQRLSTHAVKASREDPNPRARSVRLRAVEKVSAEGDPAGRAEKRRSRNAPRPPIRSDADALRRMP